MDWTFERITRGGAVPPVRWLAPVVVFGYLAILSRGGTTAADWVVGGVSSALALIGGRYPRIDAFGQIALLALVQALIRLGTPTIKDSTGGIAVTATFLSESTTGPVQLMASLALIELAARRPLRQAVPAALALAVVDVVVWRSHQTVADVLMLIYHLTVVVIGPLLLGGYLRESLRRYRQAQELAAGADERRRQAERTARLRERTELAREMHDIVAHHIASIALRTAVARDVLTADPAVTRVLTDVHDAATAALNDLRSMIKVLRDPAAVDPQAQPSLGPGLLEPGDLLHSLQDTLDHASSAGLSVAATIDPTIGTLDSTRALTVLRTIQESLTNVIKHAGPGATVIASVQRTRHPAWVEIEIRDQHATGPRSSTIEPPSHEPGHGLLGLSERLTMLGGTLEAGRADQGWRVIARFPVRERADEDADDFPTGPPPPKPEAAARPSTSRTRT